MNANGLEQLLLQSLEHERVAVEVYRAALHCVLNEALREEWEQYLAETRSHVDVLSDLCGELQVDITKDTVGRAAVRRIGSALLASIEQGWVDGDRRAAQIVACECVVLIEVKDHLNWTLLRLEVRKAFGAQSTSKLECEQMEGEEEEHLLNARSWIQALWSESLRAKSDAAEPEFGVPDELSRYLHGLVRH